MKLLNLSCNHCGAPLEVPEKTRFLTCAFCDSRLEVQRSGSAHYTSVLEAVQDLKKDVEALKAQGDVDRLDRDWERQKESLMSVDQHGRAHIPTTASATGMILLGVIGGLAFFLFASSGGFPAFGALGFVFTGVSVLMGLVRLRLARRYESAKHRYRRRRRELLQEPRAQA